MLDHDPDNEPAPTGILGQHARLRATIVQSVAPAAFLLRDARGKLDITSRPDASSMIHE